MLDPPLALPAVFPAVFRYGTFLLYTVSLIWAICGDTGGRPVASGDPSRNLYNRLGNSPLVHVDSLQESGDSLFVTTRPVSGLSSSPIQQG